MAKQSALSRKVGASPTMAAAAAATPHPDPIALSVGEPYELPPDSVLQAVAKAAIDGHTRYGPAAGHPALRDAIAADQSSTTCSLGSEHVIVTSGGKPALLDALRCMVDPGDEVLILAPYWPTFVQQVQWCGAVPVIVDEAIRGVDLDLDRIRSACTAKTRAVIVNSPNNPTAEVLSRTSVETLAALARERGLWVLSDEVYRSLSFAQDAPSFLDIDGALDHTVAVMSFSKRFSMTGLRVGAAVASPEMVDAMTRLTTASHTHTSTVAQHGAIAALALDGSWERERLADYLDKRDFALSRLNALDGVRCPEPGSAMYVFPDLTRCLVAKGIDDDAAACDQLREQHGLSLVPGSVFGRSGSIRLSYGVEHSRLEAALDRLAEWVGR